jgi:hypothetical protein
MAICNRDKDVSEEKYDFESSFGAFSTGASNAAVVVPLATLPWPGTIQSARVAALGISGTPTLDFKVTRFIVGSGSTDISGGFTTLTLQAVGTSGVQTWVSAVATSSLLSLQTGDVIYGSFAGQDSAVTGLAVDVVIKATQDIRTFFGS